MELLSQNKSVYVKFLENLPTVEGPGGRKLNFNDKFKWTMGVLLVFLVLSQVPLFGLSDQAFNFLQDFASILASNFGSLMTLGISPIVTGGIILQMLVGAEILPWDTNTPEGKTKYQGTQKLLTVGFSVLMALAFVIMGSLPPQGGDTFLAILLILQLSFGGIAIMFLDEITSKWGFGSGVSLFILAGVAQQIVVQLFNPLTLAGQSIPSGILTGFIASLIQGTPQFMVLLPLVSTIIIFLVIIYVQGMKVEIPLAFGQVSGFGRRWPLDFIYTSVLPLIFVSALILNMQLVGQALADPVAPTTDVAAAQVGAPTGGQQVGTTCGFLGCFNNGQPISGVIYYLNPPRQFLSNLVQGIFIPIDLLRAITYTIVLTVGSAIFSVFWMNTSGMDSKSVARQIQSVGLSIPGFRRDPRIIESVLKKYIPPLAVLGGATIGFLSGLADITSAITGGTSILLATMIAYRMYRDIKQKHGQDMHPMLRRFMGE